VRYDLLPITQADKIAYLIEECGEVLQVIGKLQRFGENPTDHKTGIKYDNIIDLLAELNDLERAIRLVRESFDNG
jgi:NTP pyrophosphatase (non-canonical NTP hydrolase)